MIFLILLLSLFLRIFQLSKFMLFGGDIAYDLILARNFILENKISLVGIPSSVPWLRQSAFFSYLITPILVISKFNPLWIGYFTSCLGVIATFLVYILGKKLFSRQVGLLAALFYALFPLAIYFERYPYHQAPISLLTLIFIFCLYRSAEKEKFFYLSALLLGLLFQFELSNLILLPVFLIWFWQFRPTDSLKKFLFSCLLFLVPWAPKIIFDFSHGWTQTLGFIGWTIHKFTPLSFLLLIFAIAIFFRLENFRGKIPKNYFLLFLWLFIPLGAFLIQGSPSEAYLPPLLGVFSLFFGLIFVRKKLLGGILFILLIINLTFFIKSHFRVQQSLVLEKEIADYLVGDSKGEKYNLIPLGEFGHFPNSKLGLIYLTLVLGFPPSEEKQNLQYYIYSREENLAVNQAEIKVFPNYIIAKKNRK